MSKEPDNFFNWSVIGGNKPYGADKRTIENLWDENKNNEWVAAQTAALKPGTGLKPTKFLVFFRFFSKLLNP